jgi:hypothetical protein
MKRQIPVLEECRAVELLLDESGGMVEETIEVLTRLMKPASGNCGKPAGGSLGWEAGHPARRSCACWGRTGEAPPNA